MKKPSVTIDFVESFRELESFSVFIRHLSTDILRDDRLAVIIVHTGAELVLNFLVKKLLKHGSSFSKKLSFMNKLMLLDELGVIDNKLFKNLKVLKDLRDTAAHKPAEALNWKGRFAFDKESNVYKGTVKLFGEPQDLRGYVYCVWNTFYEVALKANAQEEFKKLREAHKRFGQNQ